MPSLGIAEARMECRVTAFAAPIRLKWLPVIFEVKEPVIAPLRAIRATISTDATDSGPDQLPASYGCILDWDDGAAFDPTEPVIRDLPTMCGQVRGGLHAASRSERMR